MLLEKLETLQLNSRLLTTPPAPAEEGDEDGVLPFRNNRPPLLLLFSSGNEHVWWPGHGLCAREGKEIKKNRSVEGALFSLCGALFLCTCMLAGVECKIEGVSALTSKLWNRFVNYSNFCHIEIQIWRLGKDQNTVYVSEHWTGLFVSGYQITPPCPSPSSQSCCHCAHTTAAPLLTVCFEIDGISGCNDSIPPILASTTGAETSWVSVSYYLFICTANG